MANLMAMVMLPRTSLNAEDTLVNTWSFSSTGTLDDDLDDIRDALAVFYSAMPALFSNDLSVANVAWKVYNRADNEPRAPIRDEFLGLSFSPTGNTPAPEELALCMSFQGTRISGFPQARRRGRVFLGPIGVSAISTSAPAGRPTTTVRGQVNAAGDTLLATSLAASTWKWMVWSKVNDGGVNVVDGWVDNSWDIQRRRGLKPTARSTFPI